MIQTVCHIERHNCYSKVIFCIAFLAMLFLSAAPGIAQPSAEISLTDEEQLWLQQHPDIRLAIDIDWAPFEFVDDERHYKGMAADYMKLVQQRLGIAFSIDKTRNWKQMVEAVKARDLDIFSCVVKTSQRQKFAKFTTPYITFPMVIVTRDTEHFIDGMKGLRDQRVAVVESYATHDLVTTNNPGQELFLSKNVKQGLQAVSNGQAFAFIGNLAAVGQVIKESGLANLKVSGQTPWRFELAMAVRDDWPELTGILQKSLDSITPLERDEIYNNWFRLEFDQQTDYRLLALVVGGSLLLILVFLFWNKQLQNEVNRRLQVESKLKETRNFQRTILDSANYSIISTDTSGLIRSFNGGAERMLGYQKKAVIGQPLHKLIHLKEDLQRRAHLLSTELGYTVEHDFEALTVRARQGLIDEDEWVYVRQDGSHLPVLISNTRIVNQDSKTTGFLSVGFDITQRKHAEDRLDLAQKVIQSTSEGIVITEPSGTVVDVNPAFLEMMGYCREEVIGKNPRMWQSGRHDKAFYRDMWKLLLLDGFWEGEIWDRRKDGGVFPKWLSVNAIKDSDGNILNFVSISTDISEQKAAEKKLENLAFYDPLTQLPNRTLFKDRLEHELLAAKRFDRQLGLMFLDLDRFKKVNDTLGHDVGDQLIEQVARKLEHCLRESDTVCRLGGDEFTVILTEVHTPEALGHIAQNIISALNHPFMLKNQEVFISTSIGIAVYPDDGNDFSTLTRNADIAMYQSKEAGRDTYRFFTADMNLRNQARVAIENDLRKALDNDEFEVHYQPIVELKGLQPLGIEALVRWRHPKNGLVMPQQFISIAEETGLIIPLGEWVMKTACRETKALQRQGWSDLKVSVNLSGRQFQEPGLVTTITDILTESGLSADSLELEITESMIMLDVDDAVATMKRFNDHGLKISIDDFGTGYSSLSHLKKFPLHTLKIDRSFICDLSEDSDDAAIVDTIISMAKTLNLRVTAEGVETAEQLAFLQQRACDFVQGYYFAKPLPLEELVNYLSNDNNIRGA
ncbi:MAG: EAL domain-containing protein [Motiliproteus sp.]